MKYCRVALDVPLYDSTFIYTYDETENPDLLYKRVEVPLGRSRRKGFVINADEEKPDAGFKLKSILKPIDKEPVINDELLWLGRRMSYLYKSSLGECLALMVPNAKRETAVAPFYSNDSFQKITDLTEDQAKALSDFREKKEQGKLLFYLYGVTGSGKSEVFLRMAEDAIAEGKQVLYLVPEITLSEQISGEVYERFHGRVSILHSSLTPSQRLKNARMIQNGEVDLVIGARSAVFAPFRDLGLIIMDEEHETSYKSGNSPRYHARQIAQMRSRRNSCPMVMGSATPSFEAWRLMREGRIEKLSMPRRIGKGAFPRVTIVDMVGVKGVISPILRKAMEAELSEGKGVILFLNRRGYSNAVTCNSCGEPIKCPNCSIPLSLHKKTGRLMCHTCGYARRIPDVCPECNSHDLTTKGFGTEQVEEEVRRMFPDKVIARLDTDTVQGKRQVVTDTLRRFRDGEVDILLGTQIIAKGLNFPKVSLVGVINADSTLYMPDFRANERTFELLFQVSGRVGRYRPDGKVYIQTCQVSAPAIRAVEANDPANFYWDELESRRSMGFPPYGRLVNITMKSLNQDKCESEVMRAEGALDEMLRGIEDCDLFPATECQIEKKQRYWRWHILIRCGDRSFGPLLSVLEEFIRTWKCAPGVSLDMDADPQDMM